MEKTSDTTIKNIALGVFGAITGKFATDCVFSTFALASRDEWVASMLRDLLPAIALGFYIGVLIATIRRSWSLIRTFSTSLIGGCLSFPLAGIAFIGITGFGFNNQPATDLEWKLFSTIGGIAVFLSGVVITLLTIAFLDAIDKKRQRPT